MLPSQIVPHVGAPSGDSDDVILDRCRRGHGLWFDKGELEEILSTALGEGDAALTKVQEFLGQFAAERISAPAESSPPEQEE